MNLRSKSISSLKNANERIRALIAADPQWAVRRAQTAAKTKKKIPLKSDSMVYDFLLKLRPGDQLPTAERISNLIGISYTTVKNATRRLCDSGKISVERIGQNRRALTITATGERFETGRIFHEFNGTKRCQWVIGEPSKAELRARAREINSSRQDSIFCHNQATEFSVYCREHFIRSVRM